MSLPVFERLKKFPMLSVSGVKMCNGYTKQNRENAIAEICTEAKVT